MKSRVESGDDKIKVVWLVDRFLRYDMICNSLLLASLLGMCSFPNMAL